MVSQNSSLEIIHTKLHRPPLPHDLVIRTRLRDRLDKRLNRPLTLVCAPAGYGKSTLVSCWVESCELPAAWLSLGKADNDLHLFLSYFLAAIQTIFPEVGQETQAILKAPELPSLPVLTGRLLNEMDKIDTPFILTIDDYHLIQDRAIPEFIEEILKHPPHAMHLVLVSRIDPPLPLATLRAKGQMTEVRVMDLRFSRNETVQFLQQLLEKTIDENIVSIVEEKSEGWVTGLRLAALSLRHKDDVKRIVAGLPDSNRYVMDYFAEEILSQQPTAMQDYLLTTSVLSRFCAPLCDALYISETVSDAAKIDGQEFIDLLKEANLFVIRLDGEGRWFRYHHLFQDLLKRRLKHRFKPEDIKALHTKASRWFAENGYFEEAIQHALAVGDVERAADIVGHARHDLMNRDQWHRLERWLKLFSHEAVRQYQHLIVLRCWLDLYHWYRLDSLVKDLDRADLQLETSALNAQEKDPLKAEVAAMRSNLAYWFLQPERGVTLVEQALRDAPEGHECTQSTAVLGWGPLCQMLGDVKQGERILWDRMEDGHYNSPSSRARIVQSLCLFYWPESETQKLQQAASRLLQISLDYELSWNHSFARYFLGLTHYERNELNEAVEQFEIVVGEPHRFPIQNVTHCSFMLSLAYQALGLSDKARTVTGSIAKLTFERGNLMFISLTEAFQADLDLRQGRIAQAEKWATGFVAPPPHAMHRFFNAELTSIKVVMARNTPESLQSASDQLDSMYKLLNTIHHRRLLIDVLGMQALLADGLNEEATAFEKLSEALTLAEPENFIRPFLDLGYQMHDLVKRLTAQQNSPQYAGPILNAFTHEVVGKMVDVPGKQNDDRLSLSNQTLIDPLTKREIEILLILSKRFTNPEIAEKLFISPETVKRHLYNIYQKFGVGNRKEAIAKAKALGMI